MTATTTQARSLDHGTAPERFARGWHCLGPVEQFRDGKPHAVEGVRRQAGRLGGRRRQAQRARRLLPAHGRRPDPGHRQGRRDRLPVPRLALGRRRQVQGDPLRAPDPAAGAHAEVRDRGAQRPADGLARLEGSAADHEILPPELDDIMDPDVYTDWTWNELDVPTAHCREIVDNVVDMAHFFYIHFAFPTNFRNVFEGHMATQFMESTGRPDMAGEGYGDEDLVLKSEATYFGPSFMINWLKNDYKGFVTDVVLINCHIPTSDNSFVLQYGLKVLKPRGRRREDHRLHRQALHRRCSARASCRTCTSGSTRHRCRTRCCARRTARSTSCAAGTSSSTSTRPTSPRR